jgi:hypothetical protein
MYADAPRISPACVIPSESVGDIVGLVPELAAEGVWSAAVASPEIQQLHDTVGP